MKYEIILCIVLRIDVYLGLLYLLFSYLTVGGTKTIICPFDKQ
jgi:hypothetical protein